MRRKTGEAAARKRREPPVSSTDRCTQYALDVAAGRVVAGPGIRGAAARHLRDLEDGHLRGLWFDVDAVERVLAYFEEVLTVLKDGDVVPFRPADSQAFILGSVFGWKKADGWRRFQTAYV